MTPRRVRSVEDLCEEWAQACALQEMPAALAGELREAFWCGAAGLFAELLRMVEAGGGDVEKLMRLDSWRSELEKHLLKLVAQRKREGS